VRIAWFDDCVTVVELVSGMVGESVENMNRRQWLQCAMLLVNGSVAARFAMAFSPEQQRFVMGQRYIAQEPVLLSAPQRALVAAMAETILPRTDTPGAIDAGVPRFIELMVQDWFNDVERTIFLDGLAGFMHRHPDFVEHTAAQQCATLEALESEYDGHAWYAQGGSPFEESGMELPFFLQFKELTVYGFFTSEVGEKQVLRLDPMAVAYDGDYPIGPDDSARASRFL